MCPAAGTPPPRPPPCEWTPHRPPPATGAGCWGAGNAWSRSWCGRAAVGRHALTCSPCPKATPAAPACAGLQPAASPCTACRAEPAPGRAQAGLRFPTPAGGRATSPPPAGGGGGGRLLHTAEGARAPSVRQNIATPPEESPRVEIASPLSAAGRRAGGGQSPRCLQRHPPCSPHVPCPSRARQSRAPAAAPSRGRPTPCLAAACLLPAAAGAR